MRLRRSYSTPSDTRPATSRRNALSTKRSAAAARMAPTSGQRFAWPSRMSSTVRPTRYGIATVMPIARPASTNDQMTPERYGRRKTSRRQKTFTAYLLYLVKSPLLRPNSSGWTRTTDLTIMSGAL